MDFPGQTRRVISFKRMALTDFTVDIPRLAKKSVLAKALEEAGEQVAGQRMHAGLVRQGSQEGRPAGQRHGQQACCRACRGQLAAHGAAAHAGGRQQASRQGRGGSKMAEGEDAAAGLAAGLAAWQEHRRGHLRTAAAEKAACGSTRRRQCQSAGNAPATAYGTDACRQAA